MYGYENFMKARISILVLLAVVFSLMLMQTGTWYVKGGQGILLPDVYWIDVSGFTVCNGETLTSYDTYTVPHTEFEENRVFICGHLVNKFPAKPASPSFYIVPVNGAYESYQSQDMVLTEADADFFLPVENYTPPPGQYEVWMNRGRVHIAVTTFTVE